MGQSLGDIKGIVYDVVCGSMSATEVPKGVTEVESWELHLVLDSRKLAVTGTRDRCDLMEGFSYQHAMKCEVYCVAEHTIHLELVPGIERSQDHPAAIVGEGRAKKRPLIESCRLRFIWCMALHHDILLHWDWG